MNKKMIVSVLIVIIVIAVALFNSIVKVYDLVSYKNLIRLLPIIAAISLLLGIVLFVSKKGKYAIILSVIFLILLFISNSISTSIINNQRQSIFTDGTRIADALNNYYKDNNNYPKDLKELIPKYIDSIPKIKTTYDKVEFSYYVKDGGKSYHLGFEQYYFDGKGWLEEG